MEEDYDFIEIGTSNFDTLIQNATIEKGISVEPLKYYLDCLPNKPNVKKVNVAITDKPLSDTVDFYYIPEKVIVENRLYSWFKGCNTINNYHPLHIYHNVQRFVKIDKVPLISISDLFIQNNVRKVKYLKIDTEGHDCVILKGLYEYLKTKDKIYYPDRILFETNENTKPEQVDEILNLYLPIGYKLVSRDYDTIIQLL